MTPLDYTFACVGLLLFGVPQLAVMIVLDQWIKKRSPLYAVEEEAKNDAHPPRRNFEVVREQRRPEPLPAELVEDDAPPDFRSTTP